MNGRSQIQVARLAAELPPRKRQLVETVAEFRLATGGQLRRHFYPERTSSAARLARLDLAWLHDQNILHRLQRRIGGVRAGSTGYVYALGPVGVRLMQLWQGEGSVGSRSRYEPTVGFVDHALAVTEVAIGLQEYLGSLWAGDPEAQLDFRVERSAWRAHIDHHGVATFLKPDAEVRLVRPHFIDTWWLEVDLATERRTTIRRKLDSYLAYYRTGHEQQRNGVFPLTAWLTTTPERAAVLAEVVAELPPGAQRLFCVGQLSAASPFLLSHIRSDL